MPASETQSSTTMCTLACRALQQSTPSCFLSRRPPPAAGWGEAEPGACVVCLGQRGGVRGQSLVSAWCSLFLSPSPPSPLLHAVAVLSPCLIRGSTRCQINAFSFQTAWVYFNLPGPFSSLSTAQHRPCKEGHFNVLVLVAAWFGKGDPPPPFVQAGALHCQPLVPIALLVPLPPCDNHVASILEGKMSGKHMLQLFVHLHNLSNVHE